jgi:hypothetical protein
MPLAGEKIRASDIGDIEEDTSDAGITLSASYQAVLSVVLGVGVWWVLGKVRMTGGAGSGARQNSAELHDGTSQLDETVVDVDAGTNLQRACLVVQDVVTVTSGTTTVSLRLKVSAVAGTQTYTTPKLTAIRAPQ